MRNTIAAGALLLLSPLGFSPTGEAFNLTMEDVAAGAAVALQAEKLILVTDSDGIRDRSGHRYSELSMLQADHLLASGAADPDSALNLRFLLHALRGGVGRAHLVPFALDGSVLLELFTHDGVGSMLAAENLDALREATSDDVGGILKLLAPLEEDGTLVKRRRELIEREIDHFTVLEHDMGELAALTVHTDYQGTGDGERLLKRIEQRAKAAGLARLFVLTTRTAHWFLKRGFAAAGVDDLPIERQSLYNWQRRSQILIKTI